MGFSARSTIEGLGKWEILFKISQRSGDVEYNKESSN